MCSLEFPDLDKLHRELGKKGLVVLGMSAGGLGGGDTPAMVDRFVRQTGITFPVLMNAGSQYSSYRITRGISPFPVDVIVDKKGRMAYLSTRFDMTAMRAVITRELAR